MFKKKQTDGPVVHGSSNACRDILGILLFITIVAVGVTIINLAVFRSYSVTGPSMEPTLCGGANDGSCPQGQIDHLIVNRLPITWSAISGHEYIPDRGQIIVFRNPHFENGDKDEYIVKRVIGFPGERIQVKDCTLKIFNDQYRDGYNPYPDFSNLDDSSTCVSGDVDITVPDNQLFVVGDHRNGTFSSDSRGNMIGTIPFKNVIGPVSVRIWPLSEFKFF